MTYLSRTPPSYPYPPLFTHSVLPHHRLRNRENLPSGDEGRDEGGGGEIKWGKMSVEGYFSLFNVEAKNEGQNKSISVDEVKPNTR